jgi:uncharacterized protein (TIGR00266 family)
VQIELEAKPSYGMAVITLAKGEKITSESSAMVAMSKGLQVDTHFNGAGSGGLVDWIQAALTGLARKFLAGETMFANTFTATQDGQKVMLSPAMVGDVIHVQMDGQKKVTVQASSYLASTPKVQVNLIWGGFAMLFGGEGAFFLQCSGTGDLLVNAYGGLEELEVDGAYIVDSGHVIAWEGPLTYSLRKAGSWKSSLLGGEGLVIEFKGKGKVWAQTRNMSALISWITPMFHGR